MQNPDPRQTDPQPQQTDQSSLQIVPGANPVNGVNPLPQQSNQPGSDKPVVNLQSASSVQVPDDASDADLIEKEWVVKAKDIVHHTQNNPYEQQNAISKFKADYMKKRYNKDIKTEGV